MHLSAVHFHWYGARFVIDKLYGGEIFNLAAAVFYMIFSFR